EQYLAKAVQLLKDLVQEQPAVPAYRHLLALCYREKSTLAPGPFPKVDGSDRKEAVRLLEQLAALFPHVPEYRFDLSETLAVMDVRSPLVPLPGSPISAKDLQEALRLSRELVTENP